MNVSGNEKISAYLPCFNNEDTIARAIESILGQSHPIEQLIVIDDGSSDQSPAIIQSYPCEFHRSEKNQGRGHVRAKAMLLARQEYVLCCDATNELGANFIERVLPHFGDPKVASVSGTFRSKVASLKRATGRWRSRHLFKENQPIPPMEEENMLITYGTMMRRSITLKVGNFDSTLRHNEDQDLGKRLFSEGYLMKAEGEAVIHPIRENTMPELLERFWRWHVGPDEELSLNGYLQSVRASFRPMAQMDLRESDWGAAAISLLSPHYAFAKTLLRKRIRRNK